MLWNYEEEQRWLDTVSEKTKNGRARKKVKWDFKGKYAAPKKIEQNEDLETVLSVREIHSAPTLFSDPNEEVVERWRQANSVHPNYPLGKIFLKSDGSVLEVLEHGFLSLRLSESIGWVSIKTIEKWLTDGELIVPK